MASSSSLFPPLLVAASPSRSFRNPNSHHPCFHARTLAVASSSDGDVLSSQQRPKLVTFLGKGGSGKTTAAIIAAQHYAVSGFRTCLVIHSQDPTAGFILNCTIGATPVKCGKNLSAVRLETTKMLLEPLNRLKQADARLNMSQGVLEGVVGEELGVLPGMDSTFSLYMLQKLIGESGNVMNRDKYDIIVYDGVSAEETLRIVGATSKARLYLKYLRSIAEKTDIGRLAGPSLMRLAGEALNLNSGGPYLNGKMSAELWDTVERALERGVSVFSEPHKFGCYLVMDANNPISVSCALRYWGCAVQAGVQVSGAFGMTPSYSSVELAESVKANFSPMPFAFIPHISMDRPLDWDSIVQDILSEDARMLLSVRGTPNSNLLSPVKFDRAKKSVSLLMPGFDKSEIKLYQFRGGTELLVEAGDQRRVIQLPLEVQGKVGGAKFIERSLVITMR